MLLLLLLISNTKGQTQYCDTAFECVSNQYSGLNELYGRGYKSLYQSPTSSTQLTRSCEGASSCKSSPYITTFTLSCLGFDSCSNSKSIEASNVISGHGTNSVSYSNITFINALSVYCWASTSCSNSIFTINSTGQNNFIESGGIFALYGATINVFSGSMTIVLMGYYTAYNASIYCYPQSTCYIHCYETACGGLSLICNNNCIISNFGQFVLYSNTTTHQDTLWNQLFNLTTIAATNDKQCSLQTTNKVFDDYNEMTGISLNYSLQSKGIICCRGMGSCSSTEITYNDVSFIVCSGLSSCYGCKVHSDSVSVECSGDDSCMNSVIDGAANVYCFGQNGCHSSNLTAVSNIYCFGSWSCYGTYIVSKGKNITAIFATYRASAYATVICDVNDYCTIICRGYESCFNLTLVCNGKCYVECNEDTNCPIGWTQNPTSNPTSIPTSNPTYIPTNNPTIGPTIFPTYNPSIYPTVTPSLSTGTPSVYPTTAPIQSNEAVVGDTETTQDIGDINKKQNNQLQLFSILQSFWWIFVIVIIIIFIILFICFYRRRKHGRLQLQVNAMNSDLDAITSISHKCDEQVEKTSAKTEEIYDMQPTIKGNDSDDQLEEMYGTQQSTKGVTTNGYTVSIEQPTQTVTANDSHSDDSEELFDKQTSTQATKGQI